MSGSISANRRGARRITESLCDGGDESNRDASITGSSIEDTSTTSIISKRESGTDIKDPDTIQLVLKELKDMKKRMDDIQLTQATMNADNKGVKMKSLATVSGGGSEKWAEAEDIDDEETDDRSEGTLLRLYGRKIGGCPYLLCMYCNERRYSFLPIHKFSKYIGHIYSRPSSRPMKFSSEFSPEAFDRISMNHDFSKF